MQVVREHRDDLVSRVRVLTVVITGVLVAIATGFWFTQLVQGDYYRELAENNRLRKLPVKAPRGLIFDRKGRLLVENVPSYNLMIDRSRATSLDHSLWFAAGVLGRPVAELQQILHQYRGVPQFKPVLLAENLSLSEVARFGVEGLEYPELTVEVQHQRLYRHREQTAHVLGYLGEPTLDEIQKANGALQPGDMIGKKGIEQTYDAELRGKGGERVVVVARRGQLLQEYKSIPAVPGKSLTLSIDLDLQQEAARWLDGPEKVGAVVAMDPRNGEILALVSAPAFNPNLFARRLQQADWQALIDDSNHPLQNRAIQNTYSPGSTFKIVMATAGMTDHDFDPHTSVSCGGYKVVPHLVKDAKLPPPEHVELDPEALRIVRGGMYGVVNEPGGTAYGSARLPGIEIAGKSGTVQVIAQAQRTEEHNLPFKYRDHAWFTSFAPADNPELVVTVFAEHGGGGSKVAAPIAQALYAKYFGIDNGKPSAN